MEPICQTCGDKGWPETLVCCIKCSDANVHRYCFEDASKIFDQDAEWTCPDCSPRPTKLLPSPKFVDASLRRSKRISSKNVKKTKGKKNQLKKTNPKVGLNVRGKTLDVVTQMQRQRCNSSKVEIECAELPLTVDLGDHNLLNGGGSMNVEKSDPLSLDPLSLDDNEEKGSAPKEKMVPAFVDGFVSTVTSCPDTSASKDGSSSVMLKNSNCYMPAQPIADSIWRGCFSICNECFLTVDGVAAHLSTKACLKVREEACLLPENLNSYILPKANVWPKSFLLAKPSDDNIALYFFPETERSEKIFNSLVDNMMSHDLALRCVVENAELLVFTSIELPLAYWRFQGSHYLWGVFRAKQALCPSVASK
ncbi:hypothetical protein Dimus_035275 [Dionaea muscipula]